MSAAKSQVGLRSDLLHDFWTGLVHINTRQDVMVMITFIKANLRSECKFVFKRRVAFSRISGEGYFRRG